jgi:hypothetical protein
MKRASRLAYRHSLLPCFGYAEILFLLLLLQCRQDGAFGFVCLQADDSAVTRPAELALLLVLFIDGLCTAAGKLAASSAYPVKRCCCVCCCPSSTTRYSTALEPLDYRQTRTRFAPRA